MNSKLKEAIALLKNLIEIPSYSQEENGTMELIRDYLKNRDIPYQQHLNNIWCQSKYYDPNLPTVLLNSHHDTVKPNKGYTNDPFEPIEQDGKLYGLGSNDAGGPLVCLLMTFLHFYESKLPFNIVFAATAEEEISGANGIASILSKTPVISFGIVGEPTEMKMATAEKGLIVMDCKIKGESGHAARKNGKNAIELALPDLAKIVDFRFQKTSEMLGEVNVSVTQINAGSQHNVIPGECDYVLDVRTTDAYSNEEVVEILDETLEADVSPRSIRLQPSGVSNEHPLCLAAHRLGIATFGSPTLSDQALMPFPTVKIGPGMSERSHTANEYILISELSEGLIGYQSLINEIKI